jgi:hypothetical protein
MSSPTDESPSGATAAPPKIGLRPMRIALAVALMVLMAVGLGWLASFIGQWFSLVIIFPAILGGWCGCLLALVMQPKDESQLLLALCLGVLGGLLAQSSVHYFDSQRYLAARDGAHDKDLEKRQVALQQQLNRLKQAPLEEGETAEQREALRRQLESYVVNRPAAPREIGFWEAQSQRANEGVVLGIRGSLNIPFSGIGTWLLWLFEFIVAGAAGGYGAVEAAKLH